MFLLSKVALCDSRPFMFLHSVLLCPCICLFQTHIRKLCVYIMYSILFRWKIYGLLKVIYSWFWVQRIHWQNICSTLKWKRNKKVYYSSSMLSSMRTGNIVRCNYVCIYTLLQEIYITKLGKHIQIQATLGESFNVRGPGQYPLQGWSIRLPSKGVSAYHQVARE